MRSIEPPKKVAKKSRSIVVRTTCVRRRKAIPSFTAPNPTAVLDGAARWLIARSAAMTAPNDTASSA